MSPRETRSVGELLLQADVTTRGLLFEVTGDDAPALLRTFGEVVESAAELWRALPTAATRAGARVGAMSQLELIAKGMHRSQLRTNWPGAGPTDPRLASVAETFTRAAGLVARHAPSSAPALPASVRADVHAAQMRTMHALYVCSHGVTVSVNEYVRRVQAATAGRKASTRATRGMSRGQEALSRLAAFEQLAGAYVGAGFATVIEGTSANHPYAGLDRLMDAVAAWDLAAHRSLTPSPTPVSLATIARGQAMAARTMQVLLHAADRTGQLDPDSYGQRLAPTLEQSTRAWSRLARQWDALTDASTRRVPADLWESDAELQAASRELIHHGASIATPEVIAARTDLSNIALVAVSAVSSGLEVATAARDVTRVGLPVTAPAQCLLNAARQDVFALGPGERDTLGNFLAPRDLQLGRSVPLVEPIRAALERTSSATVDAQSAASSAVSGLQSTPRVDADRATSHAHPRVARVHEPAVGTAQPHRAGLRR